MLRRVAVAVLFDRLDEVSRLVIAAVFVVILIPLLVAFLAVSSV